MPVKATAKSSELGGVNALVPVDPARTEDEWLKRRRKAMKEIQGIRSRLGGFESEGEALFREWLHRSFPTLLSEERSLHETGEDLSRMIHAVRFESEYLRIPSWEAFERVDGRRGRNEPLISEDALAAEQGLREAEAARFREQSEKVRRGMASATEMRRMREELQDFLFEELGPAALFLSRERLDQLIRARMAGEPLRLEDVFDDDRSDARHERSRPARGRDGDAPSQSESKPPTSGEQRAADELRSTYRAIAKRLHPDAMGGDPSDSDKRIWMEAQQAYQRGDVGRLLAIQAFIDGQSEEVSPRARAGLADLIRQVHGLQATLKALRSEERRLAQEAAFAYYKKRASPAKLRELSAELEESLELDLRRLRSEIKQLRSELARLARQPRPKAVKPGASKRTGRKRAAGSWTMTKDEMERIFGS